MPAILEATSLEEAIELTRRFLKVHGDVRDLECEVRPLDGPEFGARAGCATSCTPPRAAGLGSASPYLRGYTFSKAAMSAARSAGPCSQDGTPSGIEAEGAVHIPAKLTDESDDVDRVVSYGAWGSDFSAVGHHRCQFWFSRADAPQRGGQEGLQTLGRRLRVIG